MSKHLAKWAIGLALGGIGAYGVVALTRPNARPAQVGAEGLSSREPASLAKAGPKRRPADDGDMLARVAAARETLLLAQAASNATTEPIADPLQLERATLDARMSNAPENPREAQRLRAELEAILEPALLQGTAATLACGSSMCRIDFADADDDHTNRALSAVAERVPKSFGSTTVYPKGKGERSLYLARTSSDLRLGEPTTEGKGLEIAAPR